MPLSNSERQCLCCCHHGATTARVHPVHLMNITRALGGRRPSWLTSAADPPNLAAVVLFIYLFIIRFMHMLNHSQQ